MLQIRPFLAYHAPLDLYEDLRQITQTDNMNVNVCVGKEWHRFPNSYFLPNDKWRLRFIKSEFSGQLPQQYSRTEHATRIIQSHFNDINREESSRYTNLADCDYLVDTDYPNYSQLDFPYSKDKDIWKVVLSRPFLDTENSAFPWRVFYVPIYGEKGLTYINYNLLQRIKKEPQTI